MDNHNQACKSKMHSSGDRLQPNMQLQQEACLFKQERLLRFNKLLLLEEQDLKLQRWISQGLTCLVMGTHHKQRHRCNNLAYLERLIQLRNPPKSVSLAASNSSQQDKLKASLGNLNNPKHKHSNQLIPSSVVLDFKLQSSQLN